MEQEPNWAPILRVLYNKAMHLHDWEEPQGLGAIREDDVGTQKHQDVMEWKRSVARKQYDTISEETGLTDEEIQDAVQWLEQYGLVKLNASSMDREAGYDSYYPMELTNSGFEIAREQDRQHRLEQAEEDRVERQNDVNRAIGFLTLGLVAVTFLHTAIITFNNIGYSRSAIQGALIVDGFVTALILGAIAYTGVLGNRG